MIVVFLCIVDSFINFIQPYDHNRVIKNEFYQLTHKRQANAASGKNMPKRTLNTLPVALSHVHHFAENLKCGFKMWCDMFVTIYKPEPPIKSHSD